MPKESMSRINKNTETQLSIDFNEDSEKLEIAKKHKFTNMSALTKNSKGQWLYHGIPVETIDETTPKNDNSEMYKKA